MAKSRHIQPKMSHGTEVVGIDKRLEPEVCLVTILIKLPVQLSKCDEHNQIGQKSSNEGVVHPWSERSNLFCGPAHDHSLHRQGDDTDHKNWE